MTGGEKWLEARATCQIHQVEPGAQDLRNAGRVRGRALQRAGEHAVRAAGLPIHLGLPHPPGCLAPRQQARHILHCIRAGLLSLPFELGHMRRDGELSVIKPSARLWAGPCSTQQAASSLHGSRREDFPMPSTVVVSQGCLAGPCGELARADSQRCFLPLTASSASNSILWMSWLASSLT